MIKGLTQGQWFNLIVAPFLGDSLVDLIALKRTVRCFAYCERLTRLIQSKELLVFGTSLPREMWNRYSKVNAWGHTAFKNFCKSHVDKFWVFVQYNNGNNRAKKRVGLYCNKETLWDQTIRLFQNHLINMTDCVVNYVSKIYGFRMGLPNGNFIVNISGCDFPII